MITVLLAVRQHVGVPALVERAHPNNDTITFAQMSGPDVCQQPIKGSDDGNDDKRDARRG